MRGKSFAGGLGDAPEMFLAWGRDTWEWGREGKKKSPLVSLARWFSTGGDGASPGNIWQCQETLLVVTAGEDATGLWWVRKGVIAERLTGVGPTPPHTHTAAGDPAQTSVVLRLKTVSSAISRWMEARHLDEENSVKPPLQMRQFKCTFKLDLQGGTSHLCLKLCWRQTDDGMPAFKLRALSFTSCN